MMTKTKSTSQSCRRYISSPTFVTNIDEAVLVLSEVQNDDMKLVKKLKVAFVETRFGATVEFKPYSSVFGFRLPMRARLLVSVAIEIEIMTID